MKNLSHSRFRQCVLVGFILSATTNVSAKEYSLSEAVTEAQQHDPWLQASLYQQESLDALSVSASTLPDPTMRLGLANLATDSFDFGQEAMTQLTVGVTQMFPRGKTRVLSQAKLAQLSEAQPLARADRQAMVAVSVAHLWLDAYRSEQILMLIQHKRSLFEHLVDVAESSYSTASGKTRQQDLIRAQLELTRLDDRLARLRQARDVQLAQLSEWLLQDISVSSFTHFFQPLNLRDPSLIATDHFNSYLLAHPKVGMVEQKIRAGDTDVELAKQSYKPQWGVNASYGYRDKDPLGSERADLFSVGVSFDVPLFTSNKQNKQVKSASAQREAIKTERALVLRQLKAGADTAKANYQRLLERQGLFKNRLLKEISEQAEASLTAYTRDDGDFAEVVRARIAELEVQIDALNIDIDIQKTIAQLNYFLIGVYHSQVDVKVGTSMTHTVGDF